MVTKKDSKKRLESEKWFKRNSIMESLALLCEFCSLICIIIKIPTAAGILLMLAMFILFVSVFLEAKGKRFREKEIEEEKRRYKKVRAMLSKDEVIKIYPKVDNLEQKYYLAKILWQIEKNPECGIVIEAILMDDESIWVTLHINGTRIDEYRYTDYGLFLETWEIRE